MIFGDKSRFAIQFEKIENSNYKFPECNFCYLIDNKMVGNYGFEAPIEEVLEELRNILLYRGHRGGEDLFSIEPSLAYKNVSEGLIQYPDNSDRNWPAFNLTYSMGHGYPLDEGVRYDIFLIENKENARLLVGDGRSDRFLFGKNVAPGEVDEVILKAWNFISAI